MESGQFFQIQRKALYPCPRDNYPGQTALNLEVFMCCIVNSYSQITL